MCTRKRILTIPLVMIVLQLLGCSTSYYKRFNTKDSSNPVNNSFEFRGFGCGLDVDAEIHAKQNKADSLFHVRFDLHSIEDCDERMRGIFNTLIIDTILLKHLDGTVELNLRKYDKWRECDIYYYYEEVEIPNSVDTLSLILSLSYIDGGQEIMADTTITLYRYEKREIDAMAF